jgi:hypothetical protein
MMTAGKKAQVLSPITGTVTAVNRDVEEAPNLAWRDPYRRGWLLMMQPDRPEEISQLYSGESAKAWFTQEAEKLNTLLTEWAPSPSKKDGPLQGQLVRKIVRDQWKKLTEVLLKGNDRNTNFK